MDASFEGKVYDHDARLAVLETEVKSFHSDVVDIRADVRVEAERNRESNNRVIVALTGFALTVAGSAVAVVLTTAGA